jgi:hypothetical protein
MEGVATFSVIEMGAVGPFAPMSAHTVQLSHAGIWSMFAYVRAVLGIGDGVGVGGGGGVGVELATVMVNGVFAIRPVLVHD